MESEIPLVDWIVNTDMYDDERGRLVTKRTYWCRICGDIAKPCEHFPHKPEGVK